MRPVCCFLHSWFETVGRFSSRLLLFILFQPLRLPRVETLPRQNRAQVLSAHGPPQAGSSTASRVCLLVAPHDGRGQETDLPGPARAPAVAPPPAVLQSLLQRGRPLPPGDPCHAPDSAPLSPSSPSGYLPPCAAPPAFKRCCGSASRLFLWIFSPYFHLLNGLGLCLCPWDSVALPPGSLAEPRD